MKRVVVIGGGPAGYVAAIRAAQLGGKVALIEKSELGGTCLNAGCIPTKTLASVSSAILAIKRLVEAGVVGQDYECKVNMSKMNQRKQAVVAQLRQGVETLLKSNKVEFIKGRGRIGGPHEVVVELPSGHCEILETSILIIATGSRPAELPNLKLDGEKVVDTAQALDWVEVPPRLAILGGGVIGVEFASIMSSLGSQVTVVELMPQILPGEDKEVSAILASALKSRGVNILTGSQAAIQDTSRSGITLKISRDTGSALELEVDKVLVAVGRKANLEDIGLEAVGVEVEGGTIVTNSRMRTNVDWIYAAGDVVKSPQLAHVAMMEGTVAAENAMGVLAEARYDAVPRCIFTEPEIGAVGLTEAEARSTRGATVKVAKASFAASGRAQASGEARGFVKVIFDETYGEILGVSIVGPHATELIAEACLAMSMEATVEELANCMHAHPTLAESLKEACLLALGKPLHVR